jgi:hypothetical protein
MKPQPFVALETDFVLALGCGVDSALMAFDLASQLGCFPVVPPSVIRELEDIARNQTSPGVRALASDVLFQMNNWCVLAPPIEGPYQGVVGILAQRLLHDGFCHDSQTATILVESSMLHCRLLFTYGDDLCKVDYQSLKLALLEQHLDDCCPINPEVFIKHFGGNHNGAARVPGKPLTQPPSGAS